MKKNISVLICFIIFVLLLTGCGRFNGREYSARVVEFIAVESETEPIGFEISIITQTPEENIAIKFEDIDFEDHTIMLSEQTVTQFADGTTGRTITISDITFLFEDGTEVTVEIGGNVDIKEKSEDVWTIAN